jgi:hypothetical protein
VTPLLSEQYKDACGAYITRFRVVVAQLQSTIYRSLCPQLLHSSVVSMLGYIMCSDVMLCALMLCYVLLCMLCNVMLCYVMLCYVM